MLKKFFLTLAALFLLNSSVYAEKILFIPHDDRPISSQQPADVIKQLNYEIISPPTEFLTQPEQLWAWFYENAPICDAAVVSSDALLYGGLIPSRSHQISADILNSRVENFKILRKNNPNLNMYLFGSLMRTPMFGTPGDREEPAYYGQYGANIFQYTRLLDKKETSKLSKAEIIQLNDLKKAIPDEILQDYFARREKNLSATKKLLDFTRQDIISFFIIGRDDNANLCQTHRENRQLLAYMKDIPKTKAQSHAGIDEFAMLLLARAVNDLNCSIPFVNVQFNRGKGAKTVPHYSDEQIGDSIRDEIIIAGGMFVPKPERADFVLFVNTDPKGETFELHNSVPPQVLTKKQEKYFAKNAKMFSEMVENAVNQDLPVGIADIITANGSDNFLMEQLYEKNLLFKLKAYGGWNTATNSSGFAVGTGVLTKKMSRKSIDRLLAARYLDDWAYQANARTQIAAELAKLPDGLKICLNYGDHEQKFVKLENIFMHEFAVKYFPQWNSFVVSNPWNRMFECKIDFDQ
ncbi:MAG: DUF4127 family protein [Selenomonadaceae bacterium]|nr:DUF4127 family protein [Selenomonadaceae bacterium]